tara:strand:+ start:291 stop:419 length:129 start_codon:yes stop_codon:yes gene_type:complete
MRSAGTVANISKNFLGFLVSASLGNDQVNADRLAEEIVSSSA